MSGKRTELILKLLLLLIYLNVSNGSEEGYCTKDSEDPGCKKRNFFHKDDVTVLTVATEETDGFKRFMRSAKVYDIDVQVLGQGEKWEGGDMNFEGGGQKVNLLKAKVDELMKTKENDHIVLFTDSYDVMFLGTLGDILVKFKAMPETRVLFSAEPFCWPDSKLAAMYPNTEVTNPYLNSGGFIGYLSEINTILNAKKIKNNEDDQLYYTKVYLSELRDSLKINLDHKSEIFQNLNGALCFNSKCHMPKSL